MLKRKILDKLLEWKSNKDKKSLIIEGARQVGKTFVINFFNAGNIAVLRLGISTTYTSALLFCKTSISFPIQRPFTTISEEIKSTIKYLPSSRGTASCLSISIFLFRKNSAAFLSEMVSNVKYTSFLETCAFKTL